MTSEMPPKITCLPPTNNHTVSDVLNLAEKNALDEVVLIGRRKTGELYIHASNGMAASQVNWYVDLLKLNAYGLLK